MFNFVVSPVVMKWLFLLLCSYGNGRESSFEQDSMKSIIYESIGIKMNQLESVGIRNHTFEFNSYSAHLLNFEPRALLTLMEIFAILSAKYNYIPGATNNSGY